MTRILAIVVFAIWLKMPNETYISEYLHIAYCPKGQGETEMSKKGETQKEEQTNGIPKGIPISVLKEQEGYRRTQRGTGRKSLALSLKTFLLENRGNAFSEEELVKWADALGFSVDAKKLISHIRYANTKQFTEKHKSLPIAKITTHWVGSCRYFCIE
ncbi:MAG: hypothetical protein DRP09_09985 [Candidatus Thorarchaeota archaeon]|nr:MAG: hypothetical protein DRP09_09985 [Candidatus Thorarchaeota archaeon]